jgi:hypothetical protein
MVLRMRFLLVLMMNRDSVVSLIFWKVSSMSRVNSRYTEWFVKVTYCTIPSRSNFSSEKWRPTVFFLSLWLGTQQDFHTGVTFRVVTTLSHLWTPHNSPWMSNRQLHLLTCEHIQRVTWRLVKQVPSSFVRPPVLWPALVVGHGVVGRNFATKGGDLQKSATGGLPAHHRLQPVVHPTQARRKEELCRRLTKV